MLHDVYVNSLCILLNIELLVSKLLPCWYKSIAIVFCFIL